MAPLSPKQPRLVSLTPFFLTCAAYFLLWVPDDPPSWVGALVKCLPVLSLAGFLRTHSGGDCSTLLQMALLFSALGDVCLIWPQAFLYGELRAGYIVPFGPPRQRVLGAGAGRSLTAPAVSQVAFRGTGVRP